jgi:hypothetical protein
MAMKRWTPPVATTPKEKLLLKRLTRTKKLFAFLRLHRHELFNDEFQAELESMYRRSGAGAEPLPPAVLCMVSLLQAYTGTSDAEAVELTVVDARWQMVLDCLGAESPLVSQGALPAFRARLIGAELDRRLLERTVELAKETKEFDWKKLPKELRVAVDSRPFEGAGRVEDTINLLGHAARKIVHVSAKLLKLPVETIAHQARIPLALSGSTKAALDCDWSDPKQRGDALVCCVSSWIRCRHGSTERIWQRMTSSPRTLRPWSRCSLKTPSKTNTAVFRSFVALPKTVAFRSRIRRCVMDAKARVSASMATSSTSRRISTRH